MRRARHAALIMALTMVYWIAAQVMGGWLGWSAWLAFAFDIAAIAALLWALWIVWQIYRTRRDLGH